MGNLVSLGTTECGFSLQDYVRQTNSKLWYSYESATVQSALPIQAYVHVDIVNGDRFSFENGACEFSVVNMAHILPLGVGSVELHDAGGNVKWSSKISGTIGTKCIISASKLNGALGFWPDRTEPVVIIPQEQWHAFVSLIFIVLGIIYLLGDMSILREEGTELYGTYKRLFLLDGPLTALATSSSIVFNEVVSFADDWVVVQQSILLSGVVANFTMLVILLYYEQPKQTFLLSMYVEVPIFVAILIPVMHSSGNLFELGCIIANIVTCFVSQRHIGYARSEIRYRLAHRAIAVFNILVISPAILLSIVHAEVGGAVLRSLVAVAITVGGLAVADG